MLVRVLPRGLKHPNVASQFTLREGDCMWANRQPDSRMCSQEARSTLRHHARCSCQSAPRLGLVAIPDDVTCPPRASIFAASPFSSRAMTMFPASRPRKLEMSSGTGQNVSAPRTLFLAVRAPAETGNGQRNWVKWLHALRRNGGTGLWATRVLTFSALAWSLG
jgi:hypothetical protein